MQCTARCALPAARPALARPHQAARRGGVAAKSPAFYDPELARPHQAARRGRVAAKSPASYDPESEDTPGVATLLDRDLK